MLLIPTDVTWYFIGNFSANRAVQKFEITRYYYTQLNSRKNLKCNYMLARMYLGGHLDIFNQAATIQQPKHMASWHELRKYLLKLIKL